MPSEPKLGHFRFLTLFHLRVETRDMRPHDSLLPLFPFQPPLPNSIILIYTIAFLISLTPTGSFPQIWLPPTTEQSDNTTVVSPLSPSISPPRPTVNKMSRYLLFQYKPVEFSRTFSPLECAYERQYKRATKPAHTVH